MQGKLQKLSEWGREQSADDVGGGGGGGSCCVWHRGCIVLLYTTVVTVLNNTVVSLHKTWHTLRWVVQIWLKQYFSMILSNAWCYLFFCRSGTNHKYKSTEAAFKVGGRIQETFKWTAKMKNYDIEVCTTWDTSILIWNQFFMWIRMFLDLQYPARLYLYRSGSGSFHNHAKKSKKILWFLLSSDFFMTLSL
jgi:hypothetical protein